MTYKIEAKIFQLKTSGCTYINILNAIKEGLGVWGNCYQRPTYLLISGNNWTLVTFDDEASRDEQLPGLIKGWNAERVVKLPELEEV